LGTRQSKDGSARKEARAMTLHLHEAISRVLQESGNKPTSIEQIAKTINEQRLYHKKDGSTVTPWNVGLRAVSDISKSTDPLFEVLVRLRKE